MDKKVSIVIPTYNERENIAEFIRQIHYYVGEDLYEAIVVDDDSPDQTWKIVQDLKSRYPSLKLIRRISERGLPSAIAAGIKAAEGNIVQWMDCDLSHPPSVIPSLLQVIPEHDVAVASRYTAGGQDLRTPSRIWASKAVNVFARSVLRIKVNDMTSGFFAVKKSVFDDVDLMKTGYAEYCIRFLYESSKKYSIKEVGYTFTDREQGTSKTDTNIRVFLKNGYLCGREIIKLRLGMKPEQQK